MIAGLIGRKIRGVDDRALRIDFDHPRRSLLGDERVSVGQAFAPQHLRAFADVIPDRLTARIHFHDSGGMSAVAIDDVAVGQDLKHDRDAPRLELANDPPVGIEFDKAIRAIPVLEEHQPVLDTGVGSEDSLEKAEREIRESDQARALLQAELERRELLDHLSQALQLKDRLSHNRLHAQEDVRQALFRIGQLKLERDQAQAELQRMKRTLGWRLLGPYGRIKHRLLLPVLRKLAGRRPAGE